MRPILILTALMISACAPAAAPMGGSDAPAAPQASAADSCARQGGTLQPVGRMQSIQCVVRYSDAGKRCTDGDQCQGDCRMPEATAPTPPEGSAVSGVCQTRSSDRFGCYTRVENGRAASTICVD
jgi:putative hemolysin